MSRKQNTKKANGPIPLRLPDDMKERAQAVAAKSGLSVADVLRLSIERGVAKVEAMFPPTEKKAA